MAARVANRNMIVRLIVLLSWSVPGLAAASDHALFSAVLADHVRDGRVDYAALRHDARLSRYLAQLADTSPDELASEAERLALWINAYNAYTLKLVADDYPVKSIHDLGTGGRILGWLLNRTPWDIRFAVVGGRTLTLNEIEHEILRPQFEEPRLHFAIVCAAVSCPPLRAEAYQADRLDAQLDDQGRRFLRDGVRNQFDVAGRRARLSPIFSWFAEDFGKTDAAVLRYVSRFAPPDVGRELAAGADRWSVSATDYDWSLNDFKSP